MLLLSTFSINVTGLKFETNNTKLETLFRKCPNLETLNLLSFHLKSFNFDSFGHQLRCLKICSIKFEALKDMLDTKGHQLVTLVIDFYKIDSILELSQLIELISKKCFNLKELKLISEVSECILTFPKIERLQKLAISFQNQSITLKSLEEMLESVPKLTSLYLCFNQCPSNDQILDVCTRFCNNIEYIYNNKDNDLSQHGFRCWRSLKHLKALNSKSFQVWLKSKLD